MDKANNCAWRSQKSVNKIRGYLILAGKIAHSCYQRARHLPRSGDQDWPQIKGAQINVFTQCIALEETRDKLIFFRLQLRPLFLRYSMLKNPLKLIRKGCYFFQVVLDSTLVESVLIFYMFL